VEKKRQGLPNYSAGNRQLILVGAYDNLCAIWSILPGGVKEAVAKL
jgi:hypothetical protein